MICVRLFLGATCDLSQNGQALTSPSNCKNADFVSVVLPVWFWILPYAFLAILCLNLITKITKITNNLHSNNPESPSFQLWSITSSISVFSQVLSEMQRIWAPRTDLKLLLLFKINVCFVSIWRCSVYLCIHLRMHVISFLSYCMPKLSSLRLLTLTNRFIDLEKLVYWSCQTGHYWSCQTGLLILTN